MSSLNTLSNNQKSQLRNAYRLIDGESRDSIITKQDLINIYSQLGLKVPSDDQLTQMLTIEGVYQENGINFARFLQIMAHEFEKFEDRMTIYNALTVFADESVSDKKFREQELVVDVEALKDICCSVQLGEIGSGDHRLDRATFDKMVNGFVKQQIDGKWIFQASKWLDAYID